MKDKTSVIFSNPIDKKTIKAANKSKRKFIKKYGDDSNKDYKNILEDMKSMEASMDVNMVIPFQNVQPKKKLIQC